MGSEIGSVGASRKAMDISEADVALAPAGVLSFRKLFEKNGGLGNGAVLGLHAAVMAFLLCEAIKVIAKAVPKELKVALKKETMALRRKSRTRSRSEDSSHDT